METSTDAGMCRHHETTGFMTSAGSVALLDTNDVLLGRGGKIYGYSGNAKFRELVDKHKSEYMSGSKTNKHVIAKKIFSDWEAQNPPGRFLARDAQVDEPKRQNCDYTSIDLAAITWYVVDDTRAYRKVLQSLRDRVVVDIKSKEIKQREAEYQARPSSPRYSSSSSQPVPHEPTVETSSDNNRNERSQYRDNMLPNSVHIDRHQSLPGHMLLNSAFANRCQSLPRLYTSELVQQRQQQVQYYNSYDVRRQFDMAPTFLANGSTITDSHYRINQFYNTHVVPLKNSPLRSRADVGNAKPHTGENTISLEPTPLRRDKNSLSVFTPVSTTPKNLDNTALPEGYDGPLLSLYSSRDLSDEQSMSSIHPELFDDQVGLSPLHFGL